MAKFQACPPIPSCRFRILRSFPVTRQRTDMELMAAKQAWMTLPAFTTLSSRITPHLTHTIIESYRFKEYAGFWLITLGENMGHKPRLVCTKQDIISPS